MELRNREPEIPWRPCGLGVSMIGRYENGHRMYHLSSTRMKRMQQRPMMRQVWIDRYGLPNVLALREAVVPAPAKSEILIRVVAAGVNFADILARIGIYPDAPKPPCVVGYEVAGLVEALGSSVTSFRTG